MNIVFNKSIFAYLCLFFIVQQSISMNFKVFLLIFALSIILSKYPSIFFDISDISVKSKYQYILNYRYFVPCLQYTYKNQINQIIIIQIDLGLNLYL